MKFRLVGSTVPAVEIFFEQSGEEMITQSGGMSWMSEGIAMSSDTNGGLLSGLGRMFAGESIFMARYRAQQAGATIAFASTVPGSILPIKMKDHPNGVICQKGAFLCSQSTVNLEVDGDVVEKELKQGEVIKVDTGNVVAFQNGMSYDVEMVQGFKNILFAGEGLFLTKITGPGKVILQTQNIKDFAGVLSRFMPTNVR